MVLVTLVIGNTRLINCLKPWGLSFAIAMYDLTGISFNKYWTKLQVETLRHQPTLPICTSYEYCYMIKWVKTDTFAKKLSYDCGNLEACCFLYWCDTPRIHFQAWLNFLHDIREWVSEVFNETCPPYWIQLIRLQDWFHGFATPDLVLENSTETNTWKSEIGFWFGLIK